MIPSGKLLVIAHRGASGHAPENTLAAFRAALESKPDLVELDYHVSSDGEMVVLHDATLDRTTNARQVFGGEKLPVASYPLAELRRLDAGAWKSPDFAGERLPTLREAIEVIQQGSVTLIERKAGDAAACVELVRQMGLLKQVVVQAFDWDFIAQCHMLAPELALGALGDKELTREKLDRIVSIGPRFAGWSHKTLTAEAIAAGKERGLGMWAYTVNDAPTARRLVDWGIDGLITDYPAEMRQWLAEARE